MKKVEANSIAPENFAAAYHQTQEEDFWNLDLEKIEATRVFRKLE